MPIAGMGTVRLICEGFGGLATRRRLPACPTEKRVSYTGEMRAQAIMYHDVVEGGDFASSGFPGEGADVYKLRREDFQRHLDAIAAATARNVLLTFDDGGVSFHTPIAGLLEGHGWRGHFFITTDRIGTPGFLNEEQLRDLNRRGHVIGSHSCSHPTRMAALTLAELDREWRGSLERLSQILGSQVTTASVPGGYYSRQVGESAAAAGIETLFTSEPTSKVSMLDGCRVMGRYVVQRGMSPEWSAGFATGRAALCLRQAALWKAKRMAKSLGGTAYLQLREAILEKRRQGGSV
jgi:peptidoglycan/xylan/chitin deacetylase (PgdA/CDA1 family)